MYSSYGGEIFKSNVVKSKKVEVVRVGRGEGEMTTNWLQGVLGRPTRTTAKRNPYLFGYPWENWFFYVSRNSILGLYLLLLPSHSSLDSSTPLISSD